MRPSDWFEGKTLAEQQAVIEAARREFPEYARQRAHEFYGDGISTVVSETMGSATASSSAALPSHMQAPFPKPA
eukprot:4793753-Lingulodinium_polyedra.AAC.1